LLLLLAGAGGLVWFLAVLKNHPPEVHFARVVRETITSAVPTNGKIEPIEAAVAKAERSGAVARILVERGRQVAVDAPLVELDATDARAELATAEARISGARAELEVMAKGGRSTDLAEIESGLGRAQLESQAAQTDYEGLTRLEAKKAATKYEVTQAKERVDRARQQVRAFEQRKAALAASAPDKAAAEARLKEAQAAAQLAEVRIRQSVVRAPLDGVVYQFDLKRGEYLNAGDAVAAIGHLDRVKVNVYVDEPDLGRVGKGMPVVITWDALPGRQWKGDVDKTPSEIVALGTRQVGEVVCVIQNPNRDLLPGTNVAAEIRSQTVENALTIPKEAVHREPGRIGALVLNGNKLEWRTLNLGISNTTRTQVEGLKEGEVVALPFEKPLKVGMLVTPVIP
jgi:HlyD family secretion protein